MTQRKHGHDLYERILWVFQDYKKEICYDVMTDEEFLILPQRIKKQTDKVVWYILNYPRKGRRPAIPAEIEYIFGKYLGD